MKMKLHCAVALGIVLGVGLLLLCVASAHAASVTAARQEEGFEYSLDGDWSMWRDADRMEEFLVNAWDLGVQAVTLEIPWPLVEPERGEWRFERVDQWVASARQKGLRVRLDLGYSPYWAYGGTKEEENENNKLAPLPEFLDDWEEYCEKMAARYGAQAEMFYIWNEVDIFFFQGDMPTYVEMLNRAYRVIHDRAPGALVVAGNLSPGTAWFWLDQFLNDQPRPRFDVLGWHPYSVGASISARAVPGADPRTWEFFDCAQRVRALLDAAGYGNVSILFNERAMAERSFDEGDVGMVWAATLIHEFVLAQALGARVLSHQVEYAHQEGYYDLVDFRTKERHQAWHSYRNLTKVMGRPGTRFLRSLDLGQPGYSIDDPCGLVFRRDNELVWVLFRRFKPPLDLSPSPLFAGMRIRPPKDTVSVSLDIGQVDRAEIISWRGESQTWEAQKADKPFTVELGMMPVYVVARNVGQVSEDFDPPSPMTTVSVQAGVDAVAVTWALNNAEDLFGYYVYRKRAEESTFRRVTTAPLGVAGAPCEFLDTSVSPRVSYVYTISAVDCAGNEGGIAESKAVRLATKKAESNPPKVAFQRPPQGARIGLKQQLEFFGTITDDSFVRRVEVRVGNGAWSDAILCGRGTWGWRWDPAGRKPGPVEVEARAIDAYGNSSVAKTQVEVSSEYMVSR